MAYKNHILLTLDEARQHQRGVKIGASLARSQITDAEDVVGSKKHLMKLMRREIAQAEGTLLEIAARYRVSRSKVLDCRRAYREGRL